MDDTDSIEETREALLDLIRKKADGPINHAGTEQLARAFALVATARPGDSSTIVRLP